MDKTTQIARPKKWDHAFSDAVSESDIDSILSQDAFSKHFDAQTNEKKIRDIIKHETRILEFSKDEIVVRQGEYGSTAYFVLEGELEVHFDQADTDKSASQRSKKDKPGLLKHIARVLSKPSMQEVRSPESYQNQNQSEDQHKAIFLHDIPGLAPRSGSNKELIATGELFGEAGALSRSVRSATISSVGYSKLLEVKWQGLRDLMQANKAFKQSIDETYRERSLRNLLNSLPLFQGLPEGALNALIKEAEFVSYGKRNWKDAQQDMVSIVTEGDEGSRIFIVRSGFNKVTKNLGAGEQVVSYLSKGQIFGTELLDKTATSSAYQHNLYALGYSDFIAFPLSICEKFLKPNISEGALQAYALTSLTEGSTIEQTLSNSGRLDFLVDHNFVNGRKTMLIDLNRCTGCDDCVRACASNHDNNPRFIRQGPQFENIMVAHSCMHCSDPVCMIGCPTGAIHRKPSGEVIIDDVQCIGCQTCANSCPYSNIKMVEIRDKSGQLIVGEDKKPINKATKCDLCYESPVSPACQNACPHDALKRVDMSDYEQVIKWMG